MHVLYKIAEPAAYRHTCKCQRLAQENRAQDIYTNLSPSSSGGNVSHDAGAIRSGESYAPVGPRPKHPAQIFFCSIPLPSSTRSLKATARRRL